MVLTLFSVSENSTLSRMGSLLYQIVTKIEQNLEYIPSVDEFRARERSLQPPDGELSTEILLYCLLFYFHRFSHFSKKG